ncbi:homocysteine-responsive endoplasmic reticulum-resident ubiquitin-like domain member 2 protein [Drosophila hydei]|nr:homocysteine-responsive endoplasmic reticulum-resident ubiquitin-like domain member 2 protein [Drosophila hydei]
MLPPFMQSMPGLHNNMGVPLVAHQPVPVVVAAGAAAGQPNEEAVARRPAAQPVDGPNFPNIQEEPEVRDWLDSFFSLTRLAIFVTVLYFNSSPMRCLMVVFIASVIYLYHIGVLRRRRERNNNNINRNNNAGNNIAAFAAVQQIQRMMDAAVEQDNNPQAVDAAIAAAEQPNAAPAPVQAPAQAPAAEPNDAAQPAASAGGDQAMDAAAAAAEAVAVEPANANTSVISIVRTFVITFFTSLLPEAPAL